jgi:hypothetical protein
VIVNTDHERDNPERRETERWFKPATYPNNVYVCPLCELPETEGIYEYECDCWGLTQLIRPQLGKEFRR